MENREVIDTLSEIKDLMERSTKFLSLSGLSAILVGIYALLGVGIFYFSLYLLGPISHINMPFCLFVITCMALLLLTISLGTVFFLSWRKARCAGQKLKLDTPARHLLVNFFVPLLSGGIFCFALVYQYHYYELVWSIMLIFYGLALINGSKYTYSHTRYLGYAELTLGLISAFVAGYQLLLWTIGFGVFHIVYGIIFYLKYDRVEK